MRVAQKHSTEGDGCARSVGSTPCPTRDSVNLVGWNLPLVTQYRTETPWETPEVVSNTQVKLWYTPFAAAKPHI